MASAPTIVDRLDDEDAEHFAEVRSLLDAVGVEYAIDPTLVRGLDYYTRTIFSFVCDRLGAQSEIGGGGRYDGLIEQLGGPADPGRRLGRRDRADPARAGRAPTPEPPSATCSSSPSAGAGSTARRRSRRELRRAGLAAEIDLAGRSVKGQLKHADRIGARHGRDPGGGRDRCSCATWRAASRTTIEIGDLVTEIGRRRS